MENNRVFLKVFIEANNAKKADDLALLFIKKLSFLDSLT